MGSEASSRSRPRPASWRLQGQGFGGIDEGEEGSHARRRVLRGVHWDCTAEPGVAQRWCLHARLASISRQIECYWMQHQDAQAVQVYRLQHTFGLEWTSGQRGQLAAQACMLSLAHSRTQGHPPLLQQHALRAGGSDGVTPLDTMPPSKGSSLGPWPCCRDAQHVGCRLVSSRAHPRPVIASSLSEPEAKASTLGRPRRPAPFSRVLSRLCSLPEFLPLGAALCAPLLGQGHVAVRLGAVQRALCVSTGQARLGARLQVDEGAGVSVGAECRVCSSLPGAARPAPKRRYSLTNSPISRGGAAA